MSQTLSFNPNYRVKRTVEPSNVEAAYQEAKSLFAAGNYFEAFDIYDQLVQYLPNQSIEILAELFDLYQLLPDKTRYYLYQGREIDFNIPAGARVLDIGSGNHPFIFATDLADITLEDDSYGRAGEPFKMLEGRKVWECDIENMPFKDNEFDFIYCSHVLEHVVNPERACQEIMRVAKCGYLETPKMSKDLFLNTAKVSNHLWKINGSQNTLTFDEYTAAELNGLDHDILLQMHCSPQSTREKAFAALVYLRAQFMNTMFLWSDSFDVVVNRISGSDATRTNYNQHNSNFEPLRG